VVVTDGVPWQSDDPAVRGPWREAVGAWIVEQHARHAADTGAIVDVTRHRIVPWSAILRVRAERAVLYFKAVEPRRRFEVAVTGVVTAGWPVLGPDVLAADEARGWLLVRDHGEQMGLLPLARQVDLLVELLPAYGAMQAATRAHVDGWLAAGVPDRRVDRLAEQLEAFAATTAGDVRRRCVQALPALVEVGRELAALEPAVTLDHADMHGTNVLVDGAGGVRLIDWGDCCISHPFTSLFVPRRFLVDALPPGERAAAWGRLRDAYLESWGGGTATNLRAMALAGWVGTVVRLLALAAEADGGPEIVELLRDWPEPPVAG
jgi:hypothetical protein